MKFLIPLMLFMGMTLVMSAGFRGNDLYQVTSSHPHELEEIAPHIETVYQNGRLWVVQLKDGAPEEVIQHLRPLKGGEKSYAFQAPSYLVNVQRSANRNPVKLLVDTINKANIKRDIEKLASYKTRAAGTAENEEAVAEVSERLSKLGYTIKKICYAPDACSIVADKKGSRQPDQVLLIMAHIDSVGESFAGADDNASGVAVLLEMARVLKSHPNKKTIRFFISNGEEVNLTGSAHYVKLLEQEKKLKDIALVLNMDMVGYNSNGIVELETNPEFESLTKWFAEIATQYTRLKPKITLGAWGSDHVSFLRRGVPSMLVIEDWDTKTPCYHLECDTPDTINYEYASQIGKMNTAAIITKDQN